MPAASIVAVFFRKPAILREPSLNNFTDLAVGFEICRSHGVVLALLVDVKLPLKELADDQSRLPSCPFGGV
jgi:hypothetical protein